MPIYLPSYFRHVAGLSGDLGQALLITRKEIAPKAAIAILEIELGYFQMRNCDLLDTDLHRFQQEPLGRSKLSQISMDNYIYRAFSKVNYFGEK